MAEEEKKHIELRDDFYRDSFGKVIFIIISIVAAILLLTMLAIFIHIKKPIPVTFSVYGDRRVQKDVAVSDAYLSIPEVLQWVANAFPKAFTIDFNFYNDQLKEYQKYFTHDGWKSFLDQLNIYANYNTVQSRKLFIRASPDAAPSILNQGLLAGKYGWWIQMAVDINYAGANPPVNKTETFHILVVRVPTWNNLSGLGIDKVLLAPPATGG